MEIKEAEYIYNEIKSSCLRNLSTRLINSGINYSQIRVECFFLSMQERSMEKEKNRTRAHDAFISSCNILARNMKNIGEDNSWRKILGNDRKVIGDFACIMHMLIGIKAR